jgi:hypothetical protein
MSTQASRQQFFSKLNVNLDQLREQGSVQAGTRDCFASGCGCGATMVAS